MEADDSKEGADNIVIKSKAQVLKLLDGEIARPKSLTGDEIQTKQVYFFHFDFFSNFSFVSNKIDEVFQSFAFEILRTNWRLASSLDYNYT